MSVSLSGERGECDELGSSRFVTSMLYDNHIASKLQTSTICFKNSISYKKYTAEKPQKTQKRIKVFYGLKEVCGFATICLSVLKLLISKIGNPKSAKHDSSDRLD